MTDDGRTTTGERTTTHTIMISKTKQNKNNKTNTTDARTVYENTHARERGTRGDGAYSTPSNRHIGLQKKK